MYSSFNKSRFYRNASWKKSLIYMLRADFKNVFLIRSPYKRLESFYKDKIEREPKSSRVQQNCQQIILDFFEAGKTNEEAICFFERLTYENFVLNLQNFYFKDGHLTPQVNALKTWRIYLGRCFKQVDIDKVENEDFLKELLPDISHKNNETCRKDFSYTTEMCSIINSLYKEDFSFLNLS